jgi:AIPR protein
MSKSTQSISNLENMLEACLDNFKENEVISQDHLFEKFVLSQVTKHHNLSYDEIEESIVDSRGDGGIDFFSIIVTDGYTTTSEDSDNIRFNQNTHAHIFIGQTKKTKSFKEDVIDKLISSTIIFDLGSSDKELLSRFTLSIVNKIINFKKLYKNVILNGGSITINYIYATISTTTTINKSLSHKIEQLKKMTSEALRGVKVNFSTIGSRELIDLYGRKKPLSLNLTFKENPISTDFSTNGTKGLGYIAVVRLKDYYDFITDNDGFIREELFEGNIRHYQGQVDVNNKIKDSLDNELDKEFWWLNNGITIIAEKPNFTGKEINLTNVQIVNGLQTSFTLAKYFNKEKDDNRSVLVKIVISENNATIDKIISSTNSQNHVSADLLRATDKIQRDIEVYFSGKGYYYDRRRNFYKNSGKQARKIFSIQYTAQCIEAIIHNNAHNSRSRPNDLAKSDTLYNRIFDINVDFQSFLNCCLITQKTIDYWSEMAENDLRNEVIYFKFHLSRIATSLLLKKVKYNANDLNKVEISKYSISIYNKAVKQLHNAISEYLVQHPNENITNIAKNGSFSKEIQNHIII